VRRVTRFALGVALGGGALSAYLAFVGVADVAARVRVVAPWAVAAVVALVVAEGVSDGLGVWASVRPLEGGLTPGRSVQFAMAGDFFDTLSPAGPVSSEPIMARFIGVSTGTTYAEALAVRTVAKYVKAAAQLLVSASVAVGLAVGASGSPRVVVLALGGAVGALVVVGAAALRFRAAVSTLVVVVATPVVVRVSALYRDEPHDRGVVERAVERFWSRTLRFRDRPGLVALVAIAGVTEQVLVALALWTALAGTGTPVALLPILAVVTLPEAASVIPLPASLGAYDVLLAGAIVLVTGAPSAAAAAAVLVVRTTSLPFRLAVGGVAVALLRGWWPGRGAGGPD
jgi:uncharacterized membrane protein YbhN (UPF0104 family)